MERKLSGLEVIELAFKDTFHDQEIAASALELATTYWEQFCRTCIFEEAAQEVLQSIQEKYVLGIVSNGLGIAQRKRLQSGLIYKYFKSIVVSDEVDCWKPDPRIFSIALEELNTKPDQVLFVGDSIRDDYKGATNAGIDFCFYNRKNQELHEDVKPKYMIRNLNELLQYL